MICIPSIGCDQITKSLAGEHLLRGTQLSYFHDVLRVTYTENMGAFLGLGESLSPEIRFWILTFIVGVLLIGLMGYLLASSKQTAASVIGFSLVLAGGFSNFYDRLFNNGAVIDFLNLGIGSLRTGIFNVADMLIMAGVAVLLISQYRINKHSQKH